MYIHPTARARVCVRVRRPFTLCFVRVWGAVATCRVHVLRVMRGLRVGCVQRLRVQLLQLPLLLELLLLLHQLQYGVRLRKHSLCIKARWRNYRRGMWCLGYIVTALVCTTVVTTSVCTTSSVHTTATAARVDTAVTTATASVCTTVGGESIYILVGGVRRGT